MSSAATCRADDGGARTYGPDTALVVVDVQNDFADPEGNLAVPGGEDVVALINDEMAAARDAGALVVYTQDWHPESTPHFEKDGGIWPVHCVQDTWGAAFHQSLDVDGPVVRKGAEGGDGYSGFSVRDPSSGDEAPTELASIIGGHDASHVVVVGLALDYCVKETALDAQRLGFDTSVLLHATRAVDKDPGDGNRAVEALREAGIQVVEG